MKFLVAISALVCVLAVQYVQAAPSDPVDCSKLDEILEDYGSSQGITTLNPKYKLPVTQEEFVVRCKEMREAITILRKYNSKCFTSLTQQVFSAILRTRSVLNDQYCKPDSAEGKDAFESMKCIQEKALESVKRAETGMVLESQVLYDANVPDEKQRLRGACCAVIEGKKFFMAAIKDNCSSHEKTYTDYVDSYTSEAMGLICPDTDKLACDKLEKIKTEGVEPKYKSFVTPMLKIVKTMDH